MSGHKPVFDDSIDGMPDLTLEEDPEKLIQLSKDQQAGKQLDLEDIEDDPKNVKHFNAKDIFVMRQKKNKKEMERKIEEEEDKLLDDGVQEEQNRDNINMEITEPTDTHPQGEVDTKKPAYRKRGKDKKPRKKKVMTEKQKAALKKAREKSLQVRRAKAAAKKKAKEEDYLARQPKAPPKPTQPIPIPVQQPIQPPRMEFDHFCSLMDRYEARKKKQIDTTPAPHPNKKIAQQHRPRPPIQKNKRQNVKLTPTADSLTENGSFSAYSILQRRQGSNLFSTSFGY